MEWDSPFIYFVEHWWYGLVTHLVFHFTFFLTKAGRWSQLWTG